MTATRTASGTGKVPRNGVPLPRLTARSMARLVLSDLAGPPITAGWSSTSTPSTSQRSACLALANVGELTNRVRKSVIFGWVGSLMLFLLLLMVWITLRRGRRNGRATVTDDDGRAAAVV